MLWPHQCFGTTLNKAKYPTGQGENRYREHLSTSLVIWPVNGASKCSLSIFFFVAHKSNFLLESSNNENKDPKCNAETFAEIFSITSAGHIFTPPRWRPNDTAHIRDFFTGNLSESWHESHPKCLCEGPVSQGWIKILISREERVWDRFKCGTFTS